MLKLVNEVSSPWRKDDWAVVVYEDKWFPGVITEVCDSGTYVNVLHQILNKNCFRWPSKIDNICYIDNNILCKINPTNPVSGGTLWHGDLCLTYEDHNQAIPAC